jgi:hAT family C-terminal dimerisation region
LASHRKSSIFTYLLHAFNCDHVDEYRRPDASADDVQPSTKRHRVTAAEKLLLPFQVLRQQMSVDEVTLYTQEVTPNINESPLDWWKLHGSRYPGLQSLAAKYLGIPATSVPSERIFSKSGEIVSRRRASLKPSTVDMLVFLSKNLPILDLD